MKKNILLVLLASAMLAGCSFSDIISIGGKDADTEQKDTEGNGDSGSQEGTTSTVTKTINFYGSYLPSEWTNPGNVMDSTLLSKKTQNERLISLTNSQLNNTSLLSELFFTNLNTAFYDSSSLIVQIGLGNPAKGDFEAGTFVWTSTKKITKVEVTGQCYYKTEGATDSAAHMRIEAGGKGIDVTEDNDYQRPITDPVTEDMDFTVGAEETPTYKTYTNEYSEGVNRFCLTSLGGRMLLKSLTITWNS